MYRSTRQTRGSAGAQQSDLQMRDNPATDAEPQILSQVSIKSLDEAADQETKLERQKLREKEQQKKQLAKMLQKQRGSDSDKKMTGQERLNFLLRQTEIFTKFLMQSKMQNMTGKKDSQFQKLQNSALRQAKAVGQNMIDNLGGQSKRKAKKSTHKGNKDFDAEDSEDEVLTRLEKQPSILKGGQLREYQLDSLNWLIGLYETGINGILADEMGLGKTIQTISFMAFLREFKKIHNYFLVIVPKTVIPNWKNEFKKWCPEMRVLNLIATKAEREDILKNQLQPGKFDVCLTTFEGVRLCMTNLLKYKWEYIIVDEAHKIKNEESQVSQRLRQLDSRYRLLLTGTPLQNNLHELWSLLNFLLPEIFSSSSDFDEWFNLGSKEGEETTAQKEARNKAVIEQLHRILRPFLLRRIKKEVEKTLPPKVEIHVSTGITEQQKSIYRDLLKKSMIEKGNSVTYYKNILIQLRKVCNHPYLFDNQEPEGAPELGEHLVTASGKMIFVDKLMKRAREDGNQVLIFSGFTTMLDILEDYCNFRQHNYCRLDGNTDLEDRESQIEEFTAKNSSKHVFLISTRAGGLGLNLMTANIVVLFDSDWNPQIDLQAMDRAHRIGQTKVVQVFRLITQNTMEQKMIERQSLKLKLDSMIIQKGRLAPKHQGLQKDEMQDMVNYGADGIFQVGDSLDDKDIDTLIREGEERAANLHKEAAGKLKDKMNLADFELNSMNLYQFEDVDYAEKRKEEANKVNEYVLDMVKNEVVRERRSKKIKTNLNESNLCPKIFQGRNVGISEDTKRKKLQLVQDYRFFPDPERLRELLEKEIDAKYSGYFKGIEYVDFTPEELMEKNLLMSQGFLNWDRRDFQRFIQACELFPREQIDNIAKHIGTKTPEEVETYQKVFYSKMDRLNEYTKIKRNLDKAEENHEFKRQAPLLIKQKVCAYERPIEEMVIQATQKSKYFSKEADIVLLCLTNEHGYGNWSAIKHAVRRDTRCRFDHLFMSRSEQELQKRVDILVKSLEKEKRDNIQKEQKKLEQPSEDVEMIDETEFDKKQQDDYNYLEDEEEIRIGGEGDAPPVFQDEVDNPEVDPSVDPDSTIGKRTNQQREEEEEFPEEEMNFDEVDVAYKVPRIV